MEIKAVAFDVDGTLYPNSRMYLLSLPLFLTHIPLMRAMNEIRKDIREKPEETSDFHELQARHLGRFLGIKPEDAYHLVETKIYTKWFRIFQKLKPFRGLTETLDLFRSRGLKLGVMSDFPIRNRLKDMGLPGPWDSEYSSEETGYLKPNPQAFARLCRELALPPENILYVGNSYRFDVEGGRAAGLRTAHLTNKAIPGSVADFSFKRYRDLADFVVKNS